MSTAEAAIEIIKQVGFPVVVAGWFMFRTDKRIDALTEAVRNINRGHGHHAQEHYEP